MMGAWDKLAITVCWLDNDRINESDYSPATLPLISNLEQEFTETHPALKIKIQETIQREYNPKRTGIHFVGWKSCKETPHYDAQILTSRTGYKTWGRANIGRIADLNTLYAPMEKKQKAFVYLSTISRDSQKISTTDSILFTAIHEFGHLAGLRHEHIQARGSYECNSFEPPNSQTKAFSTYDPSSIMNYCFMDFIEKEAGNRFWVTKSSVIPSGNIPVIHPEKMIPYTDKTIFSYKKEYDGLLLYQVKYGLSQGDIHGLKCLYQYKGSEFTSKCHKDFKPGDNFDGLYKIYSNHR